MQEAIDRHLSENDEVLKKIISQLTLPPLQPTHNIFHDLMSCVIEQQIHYRSSKKTFQKLLDSAKMVQLTIDNFPLFEEKSLSTVKLSIKKQTTVLGILDFFKTHQLEWKKMDDSTIKKKLAHIKGIGPWTIEMILLYSLGRPNIFPVDDYHLKQIMLKSYPINQESNIKAQLKTIGESWIPYQSYAVRYLLAYKEALKKNKSIPQLF